MKRGNHMIGAPEILAAARVVVADRHPYFSSILWRFLFVPTPGIATMGVSFDLRVYYCDEAVVRWGVAGTAAVLVHEINHVVRDHADRRGERDRARFNAAADLEINDDLESAGWELPEEALLPSTFALDEGMTAEDYYLLLPERTESDPRCGGCAGNPYPWETHEGEKGVSPADLQVIRRRVVHDLAAHVRNGGSVPGGLAAWAALTLRPPRIDWRRQLSGLVRGSLGEAMGMADYTWTRLSRSDGGLRAVFGPRMPLRPGCCARIPPVGIVLDVSASMAGAPLELALAEVLGVVKGVGASVQVFAVDCAVQAVARVSGRRDFERLNRGGGGTDVRVGLRDLFKTRARVAVLLTDGFTPWPTPAEVPADRRLIVGVIGDAAVPAHLRRVVRIGV